MQSVGFGAYRSAWMRTSTGRVHWLDIRGRGDLPTVVVLHGFAASSWTSWPLITRLRQHARRIIAPDLPAHGFSEPPPDGRARFDRAESLVEALDSILDEPAVVFGNSLGGAVAVHYAQMRPALTRAVVLASPGGAAMSDAEIAELKRIFRLRSHDDALMFVDRLLVKPSRLRNLYAWGVRRRFARPLMRRFMETLSEDDFFGPEDLARLSMPILLLWGKADRILPDTNREFFIKHLPGHAVIEQPEHHGHAPFLDDADDCAQRIVRFMRTLT